MISRKQRLFTRHSCRLPIQYRISGKTEYCNSIMYNSSRTGIYFEPQDRVLPDEKLHIIIPADSQSSDDHKNYPYFVARAVWCQNISDCSEPRYGCGSALLKRGRDMEANKLETICHTCDLCQVLTPCENLVKTDDFLFLCFSCVRHLAKIPDGQMKRSILRFLSGNVL